jgi:GNAT superfamily N-acetyltransferase
LIVGNGNAAPKPSARPFTRRDQGDAMGQQTASYRVRLARPDEVTRLRAIEDAAGGIFSGLALIDEALDVSFSLDDLARLVGMGQVWVGCLEDDLPVGMVIASVREGAVYVEEMDVLPDHGRRGLGARLLERVCAWVQEQGYSAVTLSTFRDVPWNGPSTEGTASGTCSLRTGRRACGRFVQEVRHGLRVEAWVFMRRELDEVAPT